MCHPVRECCQGNPKNMSASRPTPWCSPRGLPGRLAGSHAAAQGTRCGAASSSPLGAPGLRNHSPRLCLRNVHHEVGWFGAVHFFEATMI